MNEVVDIVKIVDPLHVGIGVSAQLVELAIDHHVIDHRQGDEADQENSEDGFQVSDLEVIYVCVYCIFYLFDEERVLQFLDLEQTQVDVLFSKLVVL